MGSLFSLKFLKSISLWTKFSQQLFFSGSSCDLHFTKLSCYSFLSVCGTHYHCMLSKAKL